MKKLVFVFAFLLLFPVSVPAASQPGQSDAPAAKAQEWPPRDSTAVPRHDTLDGTMWMSFSANKKRSYVIAYARGRFYGELYLHDKMCAHAQNTLGCQKINQLYPYLGNPSKNVTIADIVSHLDRAYSNPQNSRLPLTALIAMAYSVSRQQQGPEAFDTLVEKYKKEK